jgi:L,D-transpeptidase YcbB
MKFIFTFLFCIILYSGCANKSSDSVKNAMIALDHKAAISKQKKEKDWKNKTNRNQLIESIKESKNEGLIPEDYYYEKIISFENKYSKLDSIQKMTYEELLNKSFRKYINHLVNGKLKPKDLYPDWEIKAKPVNSDSLLKVALTEETIKKTLEDYKPKLSIYKDLKKALSTIESYPAENFKPIITKNKFTLGAKDKNLIEIKKRLQYWKDLDQKDTLSNLYDENLKDAVKKFQERHGLEADGIIGRGTIEALNVSKEKRREQIIANLERWRWFPHDLGINHLVVNIPNYYLHSVQNTDTTRTYRVVVGTNKRKTPVLSSKIDNVIFNPTWTVPPTIIKEDLIPETQKNKKYISNRNITIYNRKGKEVSLDSWQTSEAEDYRYVQSPGDNNALGNVKINFPNNHSVYLHDTNHRELFVKNFRSLSSGCVRVQNPLLLAEYLLYNKQENYNAAKIDSIIFLKKTTYVKLEEEINVHILYFTAWADNGFQFRDDIYGYDPELYLRLTNQFRNDIVSSSGVINK